MDCKQMAPHKTYTYSSVFILKIDIQMYWKASTEILEAANIEDDHASTSLPAT